MQTSHIRLTPQIAAAGRRKAVGGVVSDRSGGADENRPPAQAPARRPAGLRSRPAAVLAVVSMMSAPVSPGAQALGEFGPALFGARHEQDHFHVQQGRRPSGSAGCGPWSFSASMKSRFLCFSSRSRMRPIGLLDVILEHGDDQSSLLLKLNRTPRA
jgi:hypothetical protein